MIRSAGNHLWGAAYFADGLEGAEATQNPAEVQRVIPVYKTEA